MMMLLRITVSFCLAAGCWAQQNHCSKDYLDRCLLTVALESRDDASLSTVDMMRHCRDIRQSMNCIIWYTRTCLSQSMRSLTSDVIRNTRNYLKSSCEYFDRVDENWMSKSCFLQNEMEDCKDEFLKNVNGLLQRVDQQTCSRFSLFQRCVDHVFNSKCKEEDSLYLPTYMFDKADRLSWICTDEDSYFMQIDEKSLKRSLKGVACLSRNRVRLAHCRSGYEREREAETSDSLASACCAFKEYQYCVIELLPSSCDYESRELAENGLQKMTTELGGMCASYDFRSDVCSSAQTTLPYFSTVAFFTSLIALCISSECGCWR